MPRNNELKIEINDPTEIPISNLTQYEGKQRKKNRQFNT